MSQRYPVLVLTLCCALLAACGAGSDSATSSGPPASTMSAAALEQTRPSLAAGSEAKLSSSMKASTLGPFTAAVSSAPPDGATISGIVTLEVRGTGIGNVELLPATGYTPKWGVFTLSTDRKVALLSLDTRTFPNGPVRLRISAFDQPAGDPTANEIVAMLARTWIVSNTAPPSPAPFAAAATLAPVDGATISGVTSLEVSGSGIENVELLPATGYQPKWGVFTISPDKTVARLDFDTRALPNGPMQLRVSAFNRPAGDPTASEIVAMPVRTWNINNPAPAPFSATLTVAPPDGATISGEVDLEVRGSGLGNVELLPATGYTPKWGVFNVSANKTVATLRLDTHTLPNGPLQLRISAFNRPAGDPTATEIVAMSPRTWNVNNPGPPPPPPPPPPSVSITITDPTLTKGDDYAKDRASVVQPNCTATGTSRNFVSGFTSSLLTDGGFDGQDCGLNVPAATIAGPISVTVASGSTLAVKLGEAALNERALIAFGTFPVGDGRGLDTLGMTLSFKIDGIPLVFSGVADTFVGGAPASGNPALIDICENKAEQNAATFPQCVDDEAVDFRVVFNSSQTVKVGENTLTVSIDSLEFRKRINPVVINARISVAP